MTIEHLIVETPKQLIHWIKYFRLIALALKQSDDTGLKTLRLVLNLELRLIFAKKKALETALQALIVNKFTRQEFNCYDQKLNKLSNEDFTSIAEYWGHMQEIINLANLCLPDSEKLIACGICDVFDKGLLARNMGRVVLTVTYNIEKVVSILLEFALIKSVKGLRVSSRHRLDATFNKKID